MGMKVHIMVPYSLDKNLGKCYNSAMATIPDGDWACFMDYDAMLLTPDAGAILHKYAEEYPYAGILTALTNRVHPISRHQLYGGLVSEESDIRKHIRIAEECRKHCYDAKPILRENVSGFLMMISKRTWNEFKFTEDLQCLGVDTDYSKRLRSAGRFLLVMQGLYVFHQYRMANGIHNKAHLT